MPGDRQVSDLVRDDPPEAPPRQSALFRERHRPRLPPQAFPGKIVHQSGGAELGAAAHFQVHILAMALSAPDVYRIDEHRNDHSQAAHHRTVQ